MPDSITQTETPATNVKPNAKRNAKETVNSLLSDLRKAAARGDVSKGKKLRRKLRKLSHYGGLRERDGWQERAAAKVAKRTAKNVKHTRKASAKRMPAIVANENATEAITPIVA